MSRNAAFVSMEPLTGTLRRYLALPAPGRRRGMVPRLTHEATAGEPVSFTPEVVEGFRAKPDIRFAVMLDAGPGPAPPTGGAPAAMRAAA